MTSSQRQARENSPKVFSLVSSAASCGVLVLVVLYGVSLSSSSRGHVSSVLTRDCLAALTARCAGHHPVASVILFLRALHTPHPYSSYPPSQRLCRKAARVVGVRSPHPPSVIQLQYCFSVCTFLPPDPPLLDMDTSSPSPLLLSTFESNPSYILLSLQPFATDAVKTSGQAKSPAGVFGVTIEALSGAFLKTRVVTVWPRFVVRNNLGRKVGVVPTLEPPPKGGKDHGQSIARATKVKGFYCVCEAFVCFSCSLSLSRRSSVCLDDLYVCSAMVFAPSLC